MGRLRLAVITPPEAKFEEFSPKKGPESLKTSPSPSELERKTENREVDFRIDTQRRAIAVVTIKLYNLQTS